MKTIKFKVNKKRVRLAFSRAAESYDANSGFQGEVGKELVEYFPRFLPEGITPSSILDIGSGTGALTGELAKLFNDAYIVGCDIAHQMNLLSIKSGNNRIPITADFEDLPLRSSVFELVASNLAFQWAGDISTAMRESFRVLSDGGHIFFTTFSARTLFELDDSIRASEKNLGVTERTSFMEFPETEAIKAAVEKAGFTDIRMDERTMLREHETMWELLRSLKAIGAVNPGGGGARSLSKGTMLKTAANFYAEDFPAPGGGVAATYRLVFVSAKKPK